MSEENEGEELFGSVEPEPTQEEILARWDRLVRLGDQIKGSQLVAGNHGGDMLRIDATLAGISRREDNFVVMTLSDATWVEEGVIRTRKELTPEPFPYQELVFDPSEGYPEFVEDSGRIVHVTLPGPVLQGFDITFIWPSKDTCNDVDFMT